MLILKSASPRRKQILYDLNLNFEIKPSEVNEDVFIGETPLAYLKRVTIAKLDSEKAEIGNTYISSDTIVVMSNQILPKPKDFAQGIEILSTLSGKIHSVYSGLGIWKNEKLLFDFDETKVEFKDWKEREIRQYLEECKPYDKAGSYGIQDKNSPVFKFSGSYSNVMGFPIQKFLQKIELWKEFLS